MTCKSNINPLYNSYFTLTFGRGTKQFELNCQKANIPGCALPDHPQPTILGTTVPIPTLQFTYDTLNVEFIIDSQLENWKSLYSWMRNMSNIADDTGYNMPYQDWHHWAVLTVYNPVNSCEYTTVNFKYIIPVRLSGINFQSDSADAILQKASCAFKFSYYEINPDPPANLKNVL